MASVTAQDVREGLEAEPLVIDEIDRAMFVRYAGASGDFNPIHWNEDFAKSAGYPQVFAQGMFTAGLLGRFLTDWMGAESVRRYKTRFTGQAWPGEKLVCTGRVTAVEQADGEIRAECELQVANDEGDTKITGSATCAIPA